MIVPEYWAEAKQKTRVNGKQVTIKRFGWSDVSQSDAEKNARERAEEAIKRVESGETVRRIDHKIPYNGGEGLPIREEIVSRHKDSVITRNTYGALCINTPDILFADVDFQYDPGSDLYIASFLLLFSASFYCAYFFYNSTAIFFGLLILSALFTSSLANVLFKFAGFFTGSQENKAMETIRKFAGKFPDWHMRVYRTPMGYRILVMHKTFRPTDEDTLRFLKEIDADPLYVTMCRNQNCFRARLSPKPWRIGMKNLGPRPGVWPVKPERMPARQQWIEEYQRISEGYASCRFLEKLGSDSVDRKAEYIRDIHDQYCKVDSQLKIA